MGPSQLAIHVVENRHAGVQKSHWDKTNKGIHNLNGNFLCLYCLSATFALQHGSFVPREWLAAKGLPRSPYVVWKRLTDNTPQD